MLDFARLIVDDEVTRRRPLRLALRGRDSIVFGADVRTRGRVT